MKYFYSFSPFLNSTPLILFHFASFHFLSYLCISIDLEIRPLFQHKSRVVYFTWLIWKRFYIFYFYYSTTFSVIFCSILFHIILFISIHCTLIYHISWYNKLFYSFIFRSVLLHLFNFLSTYSTLIYYISVSYVYMKMGVTAAGSHWLGACLRMGSCHHQRNMCATNQCVRLWLVPTPCSLTSAKW